MIFGPTAMVLRGGTVRDTAKLLSGLQFSVARGLDPHLCVAAGVLAAGETRQGLFERLCRDAHFPWGQVMISTEGQLDAEGFDLLDIRTGREAYCHHEYSFEGLLSEEDLGRWVGCFDPPVRNPAKETR